MLPKIKDFFLKYLATLLTATLLFSFSIYATAVNIPMLLKLANVFCVFWAFLNTLLIISILYLISRVPKFRIMLILPLSFLLTVEITHLVAFGSRISFGIIASIFETNTVEATDMLMLLLPYSIPIFLITTFLLYRTSAELLQCRLKVWISLFILAISVIVLPLMLVWRDIMNLDHIKNVFIQVPFYIIQDRASPKLPLVYGSLVTSAAYWAEKQKFHEYIKTKRVLPEGIHFEKKDNAPHTLYILIGESSLSTHYSLYGYNIPTTPWLDLMKRDEKLYSVDAFAPGAITRDGVRMSLSFAVPANQQLLFENFNVVELANLSGYETYWISNQDKLGYDSENGLIAASAAYSEFHNYGKDDLDLISIADSLYDEGKCQVFFIHLEGSHVGYDDKSDKLDNRIDKYYNETNKNTINYDRTISHTDRVLEKLYNSKVSRQDSTSALIYYYSDHGEIINKGHGFLNHGIDQFSIPFVAIPINYNRNISEIITPYLNKGVFNSVNFINVFAETIGYSISEKNKEQARKDGLTLYQVDGKVYNFNDIKK